jgi:hypothetical protein
MVIKRANAAIIGVVAVITAAGVGGYIAGRVGRASRDDSSLAELARLRGDLDSVRTASAQQVQELAALRDENRQLKEELLQVSTAASSRNRADKTAPADVDGLGPLRALSDVQKRRLGRVHVAFIDHTGKVGTGFAELFNLTPAERETLQQAMDRARQRLDEAALINAKVSRGDGGSVIIEVPPLTAGADVYDAVMDAFAQTLGPERNTAFSEFGAPWQVEHALNSFGVEQRKITIVPLSPPDERGNRFTIREERKFESGGSAVSTSERVDRAAIIESLGNIGKLIPPDL